MLAATKKLGLKVPLSCKKGDCGTCTVTVGGKKVRACVGKVPDAPKLKSLIEKGLPVSVDN
jgi:succinate dehydrogenase/fumarate reductase-like Fe-S protein